MKRSIITVLIVLCVCVVALGFYRGWFALSSHGPDAGNNKVNVNFAKLNHILIPSTKEGRDRFRQGWFRKLVWPLVFFYESFSEEGQWGYARKRRVLREEAQPRGAEVDPAPGVWRSSTR